MMLILMIALMMIMLMMRMLMIMMTKLYDYDVYTDDDDYHKTASYNAAGATPGTSVPCG